MHKTTLLVLTFILSIAPSSFCKSPLLGRSAGKMAARSSRSSAQKIMRLDYARDHSKPAHRLNADRTVFRYTNGKRSKAEMRRGIPAGSHLTPHATTGRPLSPAAAQRKFGLPRRPAVRERVVLRRGTLVRTNKAIGGNPGQGEIQLAQRVPRQQIRKVLRLPISRRRE